MDEAPTPSQRVAHALSASGLTQEGLAARIGVGQSTVARWCDDTHPSVPNLQHLCAAPAAFVRPLLTGVLSELDASEPAIPPAAFERELRRVGMRMGAIYGKAEAFLAVGDAESAHALAQEVAQLREHLRRLERAALACSASWQRGQR